MESVEGKALARAGWALWKCPTGGRDEIQGRNSPSGTLQLWQGFIRMTSSTL
jgi:hypothetical protein